MSGFSYSRYSGIKRFTRNVAMSANSTLLVQCYVIRCIFSNNPIQFVLRRSLGVFVTCKHARRHIQKRKLKKNQLKINWKLCKRRLVNAT